MAIKLTHTDNVLTLVSFPKYLVMLLMMFMFVLFAASAFSENDFRFVDYVLFCSVIIIGIVIQKRKTLTLDKASNSGVLAVQTIVNTTETHFLLSDIINVEMTYGRGQYARGGAICMHVQNMEQPLVVADSDVAGNSEKNNKSATNKILNWLGLSVTM
jgi:hypothetical protein